MKKNILISLFVLCIFVLAGISYGQSGPPTDLRNTLTSLQTSFAQEQQAQAGIAADLKLLQAQDSAIKSMQEQYDKDDPPYELDLQTLQKHEAEFAVTKNNFIAHWGCWDCRGRTYDQPTLNAQLAELNPANAQYESVKAEEASINSRFQDLKKRWDLIQEGRKTLSEATLAWTAKKKASDAKMNELVARMNDVLAQIAQYSDCKGTFSTNVDYTNLNGAAEIAHRCLDRMFSGSDKGSTEVIKPKPEMTITPNK